MWCIFSELDPVSVLIGVHPGKHFSNKASEMKQTSGLARSPHSWYGGGAAGGNWTVYCYLRPLGGCSGFGDGVVLGLSGPPWASRWCRRGSGAGLGCNLLQFALRT